MARVSSIVLAVVLGVLWSGGAAAQIAADDQALIDQIRAAGDVPLNPEVRGLRALGMGEAFVGGGNGVSALFANPAGAITAPIYEGAGTYLRGFGSDLNGVGVALVDGKTNPQLAAAVSYSLGFGPNRGLEAALDANEGVVSNTDARLLAHDLRGVIAVPVVPERLSLGAGVHYFRHTRGSWTQTVTETITREEDGATVESTELRDHRYHIKTGGLTLDAGLMALASEQFTLGFATSNILNDSDLVTRRTFRGGAGLFIQSLHVEAEWRAVTQSDKSLEHGAAVGLEYTIQQVPIRAGFRYDNADSVVLAAGVGFRSERTGVDLAFEQNTRAKSDRRFGVGLSLYL